MRAAEGARPNPLPRPPAGSGTCLAVPGCASPLLLQFSRYLPPSVAVRPIGTLYTSRQGVWVSKTSRAAQRPAVRCNDAQLRSDSGYSLLGASALLRHAGLPLSLRPWCCAISTGGVWLAHSHVELALRRTRHPLAPRSRWDGQGPARVSRCSPTHYG